METILLISIGALSRIIPHPANMTAIGAIALFSGAKFHPLKALVVISISMFLTDMIFGFHSVMWATYGSMVLIMFLGKLLRKNTSFYKIAGVTFLSSLMFYLITNFAVWLSGALYPMTPEGLLRCYIMALPFFRNSMIGDMGYSLLFFYSYALLPKLNWRMYGRM